MIETTQYAPYKVKDMLLADLGCTEIILVEAAMPGLMTLSEVFGAAIEYLCEKVAGNAPQSPIGLYLCNGRRAIQARAIWILRL